MLVPHNPPTSPKSEAILDVAASLGIAIPEAYRDGVAVNYARLLEQAALVMAAALPDTTDSATEFEP
jgi:hypothetical protein